MSNAISEFWRLVIESRLLPPEMCGQLAEQFGRVKGASHQGNEKTLAEWLVSQNLLSRYQATLLLAGRAGPFYYGEYKIYDRCETPPLTGSFRAVHVTTGHPVILQFLAGEALQDPQRWQSLAGWLVRQTRVQHPHLHRCHEVVDVTTHKFVVCEELPGQSAEQLAASGPLPARLVCGVIRQAALGLAQMHAAGLVHGDIRPERIWISPDGQAKLLRELAHPPTPLPLTGPPHALALRAECAAPELAQPQRAPDPLSDLYALGCCMYRLLAGRFPFAGGDPRQKLARHAGEGIAPLDSLGVPAQVMQVVAYLMAKNPAVRYQQATIVAEALGPFSDPAQLQPRAPQPLPTLANYENALREKQQRLAAKKSAGPAAGAAAGVAVVATAPVVSIRTEGSAPRGGSPAPSGEEGERRKPMSRRQKNLLTAAGAAAVVVLLLGLGIYAASQQTIEPVAGGPGTTENGEGGTGVGTTNTNLSGDGGTGGGTAGTGSTGTGTAGTGGTSSGGGTSGTGGAGGAGESTGPSYDVVADDGALLWAPPTRGEPIELRYTPSGAVAYLVLRPTLLNQYPAGEGVLRALRQNPELAGALSAWETAAGFSLTDLDQVILGVHPVSAAAPRYSVVGRMATPLPKAELLQRWGGPSAITYNSELTNRSDLYYQGRGWAYYAPEDDPALFLMAAEPEVKSVIDNAGVPLLSKEMTRLVAASDRDMHATALFIPRRLFGDGREMFRGPWLKVRDPLDTFLGDDLLAVMFSAHAGSGRTYLEMRMFGRVENQGLDLANDFRNRLARVPDQVFDYIATLDVHPYWRRIALQYPQMIRDLHRQTRVGYEQEQAVVNAMLPEAAAPNLVAATDIAVAAPGGGAVAPAAGPPKGPQTLPEVLAAKTTIDFRSISLEFAMRDLMADVRDSHPSLPFPFEIKIIGKDLEMNGITRNQQLTYAGENQSIADILTGMVMKANPITTVTDPSETDQSLIWVIGPDPDTGKQVILITTRDAAAARQYTLPAPFQPKG